MNQIDAPLGTEAQLKIALECLATYVADETRYLKGGEPYCIPTECGMIARQLTREIIERRQAQLAELHRSLGIGQ